MAADIRCYVLMNFLNQAAAQDMAWNQAKSPGLNGSDIKHLGCHCTITILSL